MEGLFLEFCPFAAGIDGELAAPRLSPFTSVYEWGNRMGSPGQKLLVQLCSTPLYERLLLPAYNAGLLELSARLEGFSLVHDRLVRTAGTARSFFLFLFCGSRSQRSHPIFSSFCSWINRLHHFPWTLHHFSSRRERSWRALTHFGFLFFLKKEKEEKTAVSSKTDVCPWSLPQ